MSYYDLVQRLRHSLYKKNERKFLFASTSVINVAYFFRFGYTHYYSLHKNKFGPDVIVKLNEDYVESRNNSIIISATIKR